jgi:membrane protein YqaA with SNARE-associated domain
MVLRKKNPWVFVFMIILGAIVGSALGHVLGFILPEGAVKTVFLEALKVGIPNFTLNLAIIQLTFGFTLNINIVTVIVIVLMAYILRWFYW